MQLKAMLADKVKIVREYLQKLERNIAPPDRDRIYYRFNSNYPLLSKKLGRDFFESTFEKRDYYLTHPFSRWVSSDQIQIPLLNVEDALKKESSRKEPLFYKGQFEQMISQKTVEGQEALLNEMVIGSRMYNNGLQVTFRNQSDAGSDLIWKNELEMREIHLEVVTPQYSQTERKRLNQEKPKQRKERESVLKSGQKVAMTTSIVSPFGAATISEEVEKIRSLKKSKNQVADGDAGVQLVGWTLGLENEYFEPIYFDRWYLMSGFIYHAYYGQRNATLYKTCTAVVEMLHDDPPPQYAVELTRTDGRFIKNDSKFAAAIFINPERHRSVFLRNFNSQKPLTRRENILLVQSFDAGSPPSRWLDAHAPQTQSGNRIYGR